MLANIITSSCSVGLWHRANQLTILSLSVFTHEIGDCTNTGWLLKAHPILKFRGTVQCRFSHLGMCSGICPSTHSQLGSTACCSRVAQWSNGTLLLQHICAKNVAYSAPGFVPLEGVWVIPPVPAPGLYRCSSWLKRREALIRDSEPQEETSQTTCLALPSSKGLSSPLHLSY